MVHMNSQTLMKFYQINLQRSQKLLLTLQPTKLVAKVECEKTSIANIPEILCPLLSLLSSL